MRRVFRALAALILALGASTLAPAQTPPAPNPPAAPSPEERLRQIEQLLSDTRAELAKLEASSSSSATDAKLDALSRRIDILAQGSDNLKMGVAAASAVTGGACPSLTDNTTRKLPSVS